METRPKVNRKMRAPFEGPETAPARPPAKAPRRPRDPDAAALRRPPSPLLLAALFVLALLLVPAIPGEVRALRLSVLFASGGGRSALGLPVPCAAFLGGFLAFCAAFATRRIPTAAYVTVHEATHALFGLAFGARVSKFRVGADGGSVDVSRRNAAILLAPYFFPLPLFAVLAAYGALSLFAPLAGTAAGTAFAAAAGAAWGFHFCFTVNALLQYQTDLDAYGFFFSSVVLALLNLAVLGGALAAVCPVPAAELARTAAESVAETYLWTLDLFR